MTFLFASPRGFGRQIILGVAVTGIDCKSRTSDEASESPMQITRTCIFLLSIY